MIYVIYLIPVIITIIGILMYKHPPKKINWFIGYRTFESMKNEEIWNFANKTCGKLCTKLGLIMIVLSIMLNLLAYFKVVFFTETLLTIITICQTIAILVVAIIVEIKIRKNKW